MAWRRVGLILAVAVLGAALLGGCEDTRRWAYHQGIAFEQWRAGLEALRVSTEDGLDWHLLQSKGGEEAPVVLLIHGFGADARNWVRFANQLEGEYRFIIPDLPGHGDTLPLTTSMDYRVSKQADRLFGLLNQLGAERFHVAGNSMGGAIAIEMARQHPGRLISLGLVDAAGVTLQTQEFRDVLAQSPGNPLIPQRAEDFHTTLDWAAERSVGMPDFAITLMGAEKAANAKVAEKVWADIEGDPAMQLGQSDVLLSINTPTLVLWGREDRLLGIDNVAVFTRTLPNARAVILDGVGHVPMAEAAGQSAEVFRVFWSQVPERPD
ncbi:alpha/beta fold hydrolase [Alloalcanivorax xenomutans]|jgi:pimeloyl-ACP methyl ester carboxylesterase|uniref:alpha/beta fold hydrolase n=1 Tax=Alloalcanivorax xenomutans TaxID=1094342 RepID=UPI0003B8A798|nr:alpha/beta fold hydrolase [Alloalcanivorax xenomutans]ARB45847.1 carboxylic ester hydrolase [Alloalcanivorax xenomutans]ERS14108.1 carboxylic ester hydrolase [Alcanivorax sp. PN-3]